VFDFKVGGSKTGSIVKLINLVKVVDKASYTIGMKNDQTEKVLWQRKKSKEAIGIFKIASG
jgi:hypothetical protein